MKRTPAPAFSSHLQFVTTRTNNSVPLFRQSILCQDFLRALADLRQNGEFELFAYVIMPEHVHLLIRPADGRVSLLMRKIKSLSARRILQALRKPGAQNLLAALAKASPGRKQHVYKVWQDGFHTVLLWSNWMIRKKIDYMHANPVRKGLVKSAKDYPWSSFCAYHGLDNVGLPVDRIPQ
ncbi:MAG TPA: transposase [Candidatus Acidoferrales bacterium]|nr:transposase [Candidatus Acidoferrales bacterium]